MNRAFVLDKILWILELLGGRVSIWMSENLIDLEPTHSSCYIDPRNVQFEMGGHFHERP